jgi:hypothetical protein
MMGGNAPGATTTPAPALPMIDAPACDYCVLVSRAEERSTAGVWPVGLRDPLPEIPVSLSLRTGESAVLLNLQELLHQVYEAARYGKYIYEEQPNPPLAESVAAWAEEILRGA